jgi:hypothetical protein
MGATYLSCDLLVLLLQMQQNFKVDLLRTAGKGAIFKPLLYVNEASCNLFLDMKGSTNKSKEKLLVL